MATLAFAACGAKDAVPTATIDEMVDTQTNKSIEKVSEFPWVESGHSVKGVVSTFRDQITGDVSFEIRDFKSQNGPDLRIYVASDINASSFVDLGSLKSTNGSLVYQITKAQLDTVEEKFLLVWCKQANVLFASAKIGA